MTKTNKEIKQAKHLCSGVYPDFFVMVFFMISLLVGITPQAYAQGASWLGSGSGNSWLNSGNNDNSGNNASNRTSITTAANNDQFEIPPSACDPLYYDSLEARAWLEAQREITQNQNLIFKPDSVLEYTCFGEHLKVMASAADNMFSDNTSRWGSGLGANSLDNALNQLVVGAMNTYIQANFEADGQGGTYDLLGGRLSGTDYDPPASVSGGGSYACDIMNQVWQQAKCMDFIANTDEDGFFSFEHYAASPDKRHLPLRCQAIPDRWQENIGLATVDTLTPWEEDPLVTFYPYIDVNECGSSVAIPTGVEVLPLQGGKFDEKFCVKPGCYYNGEACTEG